MSPGLLAVASVIALTSSRKIPRERQEPERPERRADMRALQNARAAALGETVIMDGSGIRFGTSARGAAALAASGLKAPLRSAKFIRGARAS